MALLDTLRLVAFARRPLAHWHDLQLYLVVLTTMIVVLMYALFGARSHLELRRFISSLDMVSAIDSELSFSKVRVEKNADFGLWEIESRGNRGSESAIRSRLPNTAGMLLLPGGGGWADGGGPAAGDDEHIGH